VSWRVWLPDRTLRPWECFLLGAAMSAAGLALRLALSAGLGGAYQFTPFIPFLVLATAIGGLFSGLTCLALASLAAVLLPSPGGASSVLAFIGFWTTSGLAMAVGASLADNVRQLRLVQRSYAEAQLRLETLVSELAHRNRNSLVVIMSIVSQSARGASTPAEAEQLINARLQALQRAQEALLSANGGLADLASVIELVLEPFDLARFRINAGSPVQLNGDVATGLGLLFHELATNAAKYGALSTPVGYVELDWRLADDGARLIWREVDGPKVLQPTRRGFGARLAEVALVPQGGAVERRFETDGMVCELRIPPAGRSAGGAPGAAFARQVGDSS